ncbi:MAG: 4-hydroxythreonine-4-phosphate dehydrogenase, partial [uncultured Acetobacteraceae bacterium]
EAAPPRYHHGRPGRDRPRDHRQSLQDARHADRRRRPPAAGDRQRPGAGARPRGAGAGPFHPARRGHRRRVARPLLPPGRTRGRADTARPVVGRWRPLRLSRRGAGRAAGRGAQGRRHRHRAAEQGGAEQGRLPLRRPHRDAGGADRREGLGDAAGAREHARQPRLHPRRAGGRAEAADARAPPLGAGPDARGSAGPRHSRAAHRGRRAQPARRRGRAVRPAGHRRVRAHDRASGEGRDARPRPGAGRHRVREAARRPVRRGGGDVPRPGAHPGEAAGLRSGPGHRRVARPVGRQHHPRPADHPHIGGPRHRLRHRRQGRRQRAQPDRGDRVRRAPVRRPRL